jgi:hypothetical protein
MNIQTILERAIVGKKILSHQRIDYKNLKEGDRPYNHIMTIHNIEEIKNSKMTVTCTIHSLDHKDLDPLYGYTIDLDWWDYELIINE